MHECESSNQCTTITNISHYPIKIIQKVNKFVVLLFYFIVKQFDAFIANACDYIFKKGCELFENNNTFFMEGTLLKETRLRYVLDLRFQQPHKSINQNSN